MISSVCPWHWSCTYKEKFTGICQQIFEYGLEKHQENEADLAMFWECIAEAKADNKTLGQTKIDTFVDYKKRVGHIIYSVVSLLSYEI